MEVILCRLSLERNTHPQNPGRRRLPARKRIKSDAMSRARKRKTGWSMSTDTVIVVNCSAVKRMVIDYGNLRQRIKAAREKD